MPGKILLQTERLLLCEFVEDDAEAFLDLHRDREAMRFTGDFGPMTLDHARDILVQHPIADYRKHGFGRWACVLKGDGQLIGFAGLKYLEDLKEVDIGYRLHPACWGKGLATEASRPCLVYGFEQLGLTSISGLADPANVASVRVLEKLGLRFTGLIDYRSNRVCRYLIEAGDARLVPESV